MTITEQAETIAMNKWDRSKVEAKRRGRAFLELATSEGLKDLDLELRLVLRSREWRYRLKHYDFTLFELRHDTLRYKAYPRRILDSVVASGIEGSPREALVGLHEMLGTRCSEFGESQTGLVRETIVNLERYLGIHLCEPFGSI